MLQITEDTPPDMLAGAMDLTLHLPTGRSVKMSVERSTPMMDLLVQITTNHHLQLSGYTLQALGMAPSVGHSDRVLPYKPNTPIGALDTQHIRVVPKARTVPVPKNVPPGHQPFESTFRLKVHLPRNQLYVTRVSQSVHLEDIMKRVCEEKNLDPVKYEFRHPGNLDETLDPKLTLSDYQITEVYIVSKGAVGLNQAFSTTDIMALRKEEERKQMHTKTGGGVFNLIFRRGKSSSGSLSSENRSISPTHSDDSRSVTPPAVQQQIITPPQPDPPVEKPKPPQRKRRPAPKPPQPEETRKNPTEPPPDSVSEVAPKKIDPGLTICHSRNSSDSSGYHEASILSDNCNTSLPRRPKSTIINEDGQKLSGLHSQSTSNLSKMSAHSKSTSSLAFPSRKKKTAPPPPPVLKPASSATDLEKPSPVVASQPPAAAIHPESYGEGPDNVIISTNPVPTPRARTIVPPIARPRSLVSSSDDHAEDKNPDVTQTNEAINPLVDTGADSVTIPLHVEEDPADFSNSEVVNLAVQPIDDSVEAVNERFREINQALNEIDLVEETIDLVEDLEEDEEVDVEKEAAPESLEESIKQKQNELLQLQKQTVNDIFSSESFSSSPEGVKPPEIVGVIPKPVKKDHYSKSMFDSYTRKRGFQIGTSLLERNSDDESTHSSTNSSIKKKLSADMSSNNSVTSALNAFNFVDEIEDLDVELFTGSLSKNSAKTSVILNQLHGMHDLDSLPKNPSASSLRSVHSVPGFLGNSNMKKWDNVEELDDISLHSNGQHKWVIGDISDTESVVSVTTSSQLTPPPESSAQSTPPPAVIDPKPKEREVEEVHVVVQTETKNDPDPVCIKNESPKPPIKSMVIEEPDIKLEVNETQKQSPKEPEDNDLDWQYQLPSPPKAFRDSSPVAFTDVTIYESAGVTDSVVTSPELFEKLKVIKDSQAEKETVSDVTSVVSEEEKPILSKLSLEHLEKRKSLVYNRELATSLKISDTSKGETFSSSLANFEKTYEEVKRSSHQKEAAVAKSTLPNFKITTYDNPKQKLNIFEDDTIRSNTDSSSKRGSVNNSRRPSEEHSLSKGYVGRSMENISSRKDSLDDDFKKPTEYKFYRPQSLAPKTQFVSVLRSESFSTEQTWTPSKPVTRSKSQVALNKYKDDKAARRPSDESLSKSNSLFDVSGLQSLGVMRLIQNKLNTPNNSMEELDKEESYQRQPEIKSEVQNRVEEKPEPKVYHYHAPSINMGTWSERPKIPVNVKDDPDYKFSNKDAVNSKLIVNTTNNDIRSSNSIEVKSKLAPTPSFNGSNGVNVRVNSDYRNVSIKVNGSEPISAQNTGNVVIKIGEAAPKPAQNFRKPLGNVNKIEPNQRPHSIAFGSDFDISRVPIVRSVEFKKPFKDLHNTSITQIYQNNNFKAATLNKNAYNSEVPVNGADKFSSTYRSNEALAPKAEPKPVFRLNSYVQGSAPVVRGFRSDASNRMSWNQPHSFSTLPAKTAAKESTVNKAVPFSQVNLRRTESTKLEGLNVAKAVPKPPAPPSAPKAPKPAENCGGDPKEELLRAIRDFGGKKGLRAVKA